MALLENNWLRIHTSTNGARLEKVEGIRTHFQYISPENQSILFPNVGRIHENNVHIQKIKLPENGLVANEIFDTVEVSPKTVTYALESSNEMHQAYPFPFRLEVAYKLRSFHINIFFTIKNIGLTAMPIHIGHEIQFNAPPFVELENRGTISFKHCSPLSILTTDENNYMSRRHGSLHLVNNSTELSCSNYKIRSCFVDERQTKHIAIYDVYKRPYLTVEAKSPVYHIGTDLKSNAPRITASPLWGIADRDDFRGQLDERPYIIVVPKGRTITIGYVIQFNAENSYFVERPGLRDKRTFPTDDK